MIDGPRFSVLRLSSSVEPERDFRVEELTVLNYAARPLLVISYDGVLDRFFGDCACFSIDFSF